MCKYWDIICVAKTLRIEAILAMQSATIKSYKRSYTTAICCETVSRYSKIGVCVIILLPIVLR